jgi:hypothetical protein
MAAVFIFGRALQPLPGFRCAILPIATACTVDALLAVVAINQKSGDATIAFVLVLCITLLPFGPAVNLILYQVSHWFEHTY